MPKTMSWSVLANGEGDDVTNEPRNKPKGTQRIRSTSVSPDAPMIVEESTDDERVAVKTLSRTAETITSLPAASGSADSTAHPSKPSPSNAAELGGNDEGARRGRYSYVRRPAQK